MQEVVHDTDVAVLDSRYAEAYYTGHIQSALNLPFAAILNKDKTFKSPNEISALMAELNISDKHVTTLQRYSSNSETAHSTVTISPPESLQR